MGYYRDICNRLIEDAKRITAGRGFCAEYAIEITENVGQKTMKLSAEKVDPDFFAAILVVARKMLDLLNEKETKKTEQSFDIKGKRDEALMNLYRHFNALTGEKIIVGKLGPMHEVLNAIEKLEHARHMETADEIAKLSIEKLEKLASPMPTIKMSGIPKEFRDDLRKCGKKEGSEDDD